MALTNQQVQQAYLAVIGRPAEGDAVTWASVAALDVASLVNLITATRNNTDFNKNNTTFVENLYMNLLGREGDEEGIKFWSDALAAGTTYGDLVMKFSSAALSTTEDMYTLQNKLAVAEQISTKIKTFTPGIASEAKLKSMMSVVDAETSIDDIQEDINSFIGQYVNGKKTTVKPGAEEPTKGSDEYAQTYNATIKLGEEKGGINIEGSTTYNDTLNLTVKGSADNGTLTGSDIGSISNLYAINLNLRDSRIKESTLNTKDLAGAAEVVIKGKSNDTFTVDSAMTTLDTGDGDDTINVNSNVETLKAGNGNDTIIASNAKVTTLDAGNGDDKITVTKSTISTLNAGNGNDIITLGDGAKVSKLNAGNGDDTISVSSKANVTNATIDGGAGTNSLKLTDGKVDLTKTTLTNISAISGEGKLKAAQLNGIALNLGTERLNAAGESTGTYDAAKLEVAADKASGAIDLTKVAVAEESTGHELNITNVKNSTIKLNNDALGNSDDAANTDATKVTITGTAGNDVITLESGKVTSLDSNEGNDKVTIASAASVNTLNLNNGANTVTVAGKVNALTAGAGDDNVNVSGEVTRLTTGTGNDTISVSGKVKTLEAGEGDDKISVTAGEVDTLNAGAGADTISVAAGARVKDLDAGDGDDIIAITAGAVIKNLNGGTGNNTLKLENGVVDLSTTKLTNIQTITGRGKIQSSDITGKNITLGSEKLNAWNEGTGEYDITELEIKGKGTATNDNINLSSLKIAAGSTGHKLNITNFKSGSLTLNDNNLGNASQDESAVDATTVTVTGTESNDTITINSGKIKDVSTGKGADTVIINAGANVATLNTGDGADIINISGTVGTLDAGDGDDKIVLSGSGTKVGTIDAGAGNDNIEVQSGATVSTINLGAGDDTITLKSGAGTNLTINGGDGKDTLTLDASSSSVDFTKITKISGIEVLDISGGSSTSGAKISYDSIKDNLNLTLSGSGSLTIETGDNKDINLAGFKGTSGQNSGGITLENINTGDTIKLNKDDGIKETIKLQSAAGNGNDPHTTITGLASGDMLNVSGAFNGFSGSSGSFAEVSGTTTLSSSKAYFFKGTVDNIDFTEQNLGQALLNAISGASSSISQISVSSSAKAIFALNSGDGNSYLFSVSGGTSTTGIEKATVKLLAVVDNTIDTQDKVSGGDITFA